MEVNATGDGLGYEAVRRAAGVIRRDDLARVRLTGRDPVRMMQGLITNDLAGTPEGRGVYAAMLTPKGRMIAELRAFRYAVDGGVEVLLDLPETARSGTLDHLKKFVPPLFARWKDVTDETSALGVYGPAAQEALAEALGSEVPELEEDGFHRAGPDAELLVIGTRYAGGEPGYDLIGPVDRVAELEERLLDSAAVRGGGRLDPAALDTLRIEAGRPRYGAELTEETIPTEAYEATGMLPRAISFSKGCYTGQEVIVRIAHRGHVNRHLRGILLGDLPLPEPGTVLVREGDGKAMARITSVARSPLLEQGIALAYVRREIEPGSALRVEGPDGPEVRVVTLPFRKEAA